MDRADSSLSNEFALGTQRPRETGGQVLYTICHSVGCFSLTLENGIFGHTCKFAQVRGG